MTTQPPTHLSTEDERLVDLVREALTDPDLHTATRMRLQHELTKLLHDTHEAAYGPSGHEVHTQRLATHGAHLPHVLEDVLVDPNLNTDRRMRLHHQISELVRETK